MEERAQVLFGSLLARGQVLGWEWR